MSGSEVCVGLAPHHLMFEITAQATQKAVSKRNFLINVSGIIQKKHLFVVFLAFLMDMKRRRMFSVLKLSDPMFSVKDLYYVYSLKSYTVGVVNSQCSSKYLKSPTMY